VLRGGQWSDAHAGLEKSISRIVRSLLASRPTMVARTPTLIASRSWVDQSSSPHHVPTRSVHELLVRHRHPCRDPDPRSEERLVTTDLEASKDIVRAFVAAWNDRNFDDFDSLMGDHATLTVSGMTVPCSPAGTRAIAEEWTRAFPDWKFELRSLIAEGDRVVAHMPYSGTFTNPLTGIAATGRFARVDEMVIFRIAEGKVAEAWEVYDEAGMWRQLGVALPV
jgi:steroid delta-isomerase-like uncharacterized protein